jgi:hypothetical protein
MRRLLRAKYIALAMTLVNENKNATEIFPWQGIKAAWHLTCGFWVQQEMRLIK